MLHTLILADDLSGAADSAITCVASGMTAVVTLGEQQAESDSDVLSIDCDTRHLTADAAAKRIQQVFRHYAHLPELMVFKKLDSTLRGNIAAEIEAVLQERRRHTPAHQRVVALLAPAFPARGRTTVNGEQLVDGLPISQFGALQQGAGVQSGISALFAESGLQIAALDLAVIRSGDVSLCQSMLSAAAVVDVLLCDAEMDDDLRAIAKASSVLGANTVWAGSAGLAYHLPGIAGTSGKRSEVKPPQIASGPTLFVIGSRSSASKEQIKLLQSAEHIHTQLISPSVLLAGESSFAWKQHAKAIESALQSGMDILVAIEAGEIYGAEDARRMSSALGSMISPMGKLVGTLVASGGETARAILDAWGVRSLDMIGEVEAGLPFAATMLHDRKIAVLTKAGAFGDPQTLLRCREFINSLERDQKLLSQRGN